MSLKKLLPILAIPLIQGCQTLDRDFDNAFYTQGICQAKATHYFDRLQERGIKSDILVYRPKGQSEFHAIVKYLNPKNMKWTYADPTNRTKSLIKPNGDRWLLFRKGKK